MRINAAPALRTALACAGVAALFAALAWAGVSLAKEGGIAPLWLPNALLLGVLLRERRGRTAALALSCLLTNAAVNLWLGVPPFRSVAFAVANAGEAVAAAWMVRRWCGGPPDLADLGDLGRFCLVAGLAAPALSGVVAGAVLLLDGAAAGMGAWFTWAATDALGLLIGAPIVVAVVDAWAGYRWRGLGRPVEGAAVLAAGWAAVAAVFAQSSYPLLFLAGPFVLIAAFRVSGLGVALFVAGVTAIGTVATASGSGPIALIHGGPVFKLLILQLFFATIFLMGLPVSAVLARLARTRAELARANELADSALANMREVVFRTDADGRWAFLNPAWEALTGRAVADSLGRLTSELLHPDDRAAARDLYPRIAAGEVGEAVLHQRFTGPDGERRHVEVSLRRLTAPDGRFDGTAGAIRDVTERRLAEEALAASVAEREAAERELRLLAANATDAVFRLSLDGTCRYASPSVGELLGIEPGLVVGRSMLQRFHPDEDAAVRASFARLAAGEAERDLIRYRSKPFGGGSWKWLEANCGLVRDEAGRPAELIVSIRDVSARKAMEDELALARDAAEAAARAKADFLAHMSHEIRTPMNGVLGFAQLLLAGDLKPEQREQARMVAESGQAMMRLLNDILDLSKIEAGRMVADPRPTDLRHAARGCLQLMVPGAASRAVELDCRFDDDVPALVLCDDLRFRQIMLNLLGNAVKFTSNGRVSVRGRMAGGEVLVDVLDTGVGIPTDRLYAIFDPFAQGEAGTARRYGGTGLGLTISSQLAGIMGGRLSVESELGRGSCFTLALPARAAEPAPPAASEAAPAQREAANAPRVLLAEDHQVNQMLGVAMLEGLGCRVELARDGVEAVAALSGAGDDPFDLVLMDVQMPNMDGLEATRVARRDGFAPPDLPIVAITANAYPEDVAACLRAGMQGHLPKPLRIADLADAVARWTGPRKLAA